MTRSDSLTLILGGTGKTGRRIARILREANTPVRTAARSGADVSFDWDDTATHANALLGVDRMYVVPPAFQTDFASTVIGFIEQAKRAGVQHFTYLSARGIEHAPDNVALRAVELHLLNEDSPTFTILRPSFFMQNFTEGAFASALSTGTLALPAGDGAEAFIDAYDIASVAAATLRDPSSHAGSQYELTGPAALTHAEVARNLSASGHRVEYQPVSPADWIQQATSHGLPADYAGFLAALLSEIGEGNGARPTGEVERILGRPATALSEVVKREITAAG
ncbi:uncharacterized protein YbjT (DUF2867 family) [Salinibacterium sp. CAN_S4]|uniref:NmrA family NAD(P)-binding protein n=1 Tax=Salinibacterium sp. CAN_S4 TaxID=2787727 RepID=UPI0018EFBEA3